MRRKAILAALAIAAPLSLWTSSAHACRNPQRAPSDLTVNDARRTITCVINHRRAHHHLPPLHGAFALAAAAQEHSDAMTANDFFSHEGDGTPESRAESAGYTAGASVWGVGENLGYGCTDPEVHARSSTPGCRARRIGRCCSPGATGRSRSTSPRIPDGRRQLDRHHVYGRPRIPKGRLRTGAPRRE